MKELRRELEYIKKQQNKFLQELEKDSKDHLRKLNKHLKNNFINNFEQTLSTYTTQIQNL